MSEKKLSIPNKQDNLKSQAVSLSSQLLQFLIDRQHDEPPLPKRETWTEDTDKMIKYFQETMGLYSLRYGAKVIAVRNELSSRGLQDKELDNYYEHPTNPIGIRIVAERIGALAERLPQ